jgi:hypothetical protein
MSTSDDAMMDANKAFIEKFEACMNRPDFKFRFAVGDPEHNFSTTWSAFGHRNEYYLGARAFMGSTKISLHNSGTCRVAIIDTQFEELAIRGLPRPADRALTKWKRKPTPDVGAVHVASVVFPTDYLKKTDTPIGTAKKPLTIFSPAPSGSAVEVGFFYSREPAEALEPKLVKIGKPLIRATLDNGESVSIVVRQAKFDPAFLPTREKSEGIKKLVHVVIPVGAEMSDLTAAVWNSPADDGTGCLYIVEVGGVAARRNS